MMSILLGLSIGGALALMLVSSAMHARAATRTVRSLDDLPERSRIVVLGCPPDSGRGSPNPYFMGRVASAAAAYHHRRQRRILCSGTTRENGRDEARALAEMLETASVPRDAIEVDSRSDRTIDTIDYAAARYAGEPITLVTQPFHMPRALFLARSRGLDAWGLRAAGPRPGSRVRLREAVARLRAVFDIWIARR